VAFYFCKTNKMKFFFILSFVILPLAICAQTFKTKNVFIITTDGFRWQEVFTGADSSLINDENYTADTSLTKAMYWDASAARRREMLLPFFWNVIAKKGQLYGNRMLQNKVNVKNIYKISYPGYNEMLTGYADLHFIPNTPVNNKNVSVLEWLNQLPGYAGKVVAFASWNKFPFILNKERSKLFINSGYQSFDDGKDSVNDFINQVQEGLSSKPHTRHDLLTCIGAQEYIRTNHPRVVFIGLGETDEAAHGNRYDEYLEKANMADRMIAGLWKMVQSDPFYKDSTTFIITTDHGRGNRADNWHGHGSFTKGSGQTWLAVLGPGNNFPCGEINEEEQIYNNQLAATIAVLLGEKFISSHKTGKPVQFAGAVLNSTTIGKR
jgi:hypothetical protein